MDTTQRGSVFEWTMRSEREFAHPLWDVEARVEFTSPSGRERCVDAFWDGGQTWRVRLSPDEVGRWTWRSVCGEDAGLHGRGGELECVPAAGGSAWAMHGELRIAPGGTHFVHADGTPFFWLGDTAWNGLLRATDEDWDRYLALRASQGFNVIQVVSTQWRGAGAELIGGSAYHGQRRIEARPEFFRAMEGRLAAIARHGMVAAPVILWAIFPDDPGRALWDEDAARLARYIVARWGAYPVVWMLAGDSDYTQQRADRWKRIGRAVFGDRERGHLRMTTMHPCGQNWCGDELRDEPWMDFLGIQSGHGDGRDHLQWLLQGPPAQRWRGKRAMPLVNLEPNYEAHPGYHTRRLHGEEHVRRAAYWSLLIAPTAGVTFGHNAIWPWNAQRGPCPGHPAVGEVDGFEAGLETPGTRSMGILRQLMETLPWHRLRPTQDLLLDQPGVGNIEHYVTAGASVEGDAAVAYLPAGGTLRLRTGLLPGVTRARWFDPREGIWTTAAAALAGPTWTAVAPNDEDWVLVLDRA